MTRRLIGAVGALVLLGCSKDAPSSSHTPSPVEDQGPVEGRNYPQVELAKAKDAIKLSGELLVKGYERGVLQVDAYLPTRKIEGKTPLTTKQFPSPGPFELLLPAGTEKVQLYAILDFEGDGPSAVDATAEYEGNPIDLTQTLSGVRLSIDPTNTKLPPPDGGGKDSRPPWEQDKAPEGTSGSTSSPGGGKIHTEAPPGAPGGAPVPSEAPLAP